MSRMIFVVAMCMSMLGCGGESPGPNQSSAASSGDEDAGVIDCTKGTGKLGESCKNDCTCDSQLLLVCNDNGVCDQQTQICVMGQGKGQMGDDCTTNGKPDPYLCAGCACASFTKDGGAMTNTCGNYPPPGHHSHFF